MVDTQGQTVTQNPDLSSWFFSLTNLSISKKLTYNNEFHLRHSSFANDKATFIFRPGLTYATSDEVAFSVGYSLLRNYPSGPFPSAIPFTEQNVWQQLQLFHGVGNLKIAHRIRQEQRFVETIEFDPATTEASIGEVVNRNRFRYRIQFITPSITLGKFSMNVQAFNEFWFSQTQNYKPLDFARNWMYLGLDFPQPCFTFHVGYLNQYDKLGNGGFVNYNVIQFMVTTNLTFKGKESEKE